MAPSRALRLLRAHIAKAMIEEGWNPPVPTEAQTHRIIDDFNRRSLGLASLDLSPMQITVLTLQADGLERKEIAEQCNLSPETIKTYQRKLYQRLGAKNVAHAVAIGFRHGLLS